MVSLRGICLLFFGMGMLASCAVRPSALFVETPELLDQRVDTKVDSIEPIPSTSQVPLWQEEGYTYPSGGIHMQALPEGQQPIGSREQAVLLWFTNSGCGSVCREQRALIESLSQSRLMGQLLIWEVEIERHRELSRTYQVEHPGVLISIDLEGTQIGRLDRAVSMDRITDFLWSH